MKTKSNGRAKGAVYRTVRGKRLITFEASDGWVEWLNGFTDYIGMARSQAIDHALRRLAMYERYTSLPPKR